MKIDNPKVGVYEKNNRIVGDLDDVKGLTVSFLGEENIVSISPSGRVQNSSLEFLCSRASFFADCGVNFRGAAFLGEGCSIYIGERCKFVSKSSFNLAEFTEVRFGEDCLIAGGVDLRTHDSHPIFDKASGERVNVSASIFIGDRVWLGSKCEVKKGVTIGSDCVIGMGAVVINDVPPGSVVVGNPGKIVRSNVVWSSVNINRKPPFFFQNIDDLN